MPSYNSGEYIRKSIDSVLNQSYKNFELIIIDDCSSDNTVDIITSYQDKRIKLLKNETNQGAGITRNKGFLEIIPNVSNNPKILFLTRLWEPNPLKDNASKIELEYYNETIQLNKVRMDALNMIHTQFNERSTIGINDIPYSRRMAPDFILPKEKTHRRNFINMMKEHEICITSTGLHKSTGWRFGEFVAASRAIISEPLNYVVPGNFDNYLPFNNIEELYLAIEKLVNDKELRYDMMKRNNIYYNNYLKPDRLILNTITSL